MCSTVFAGASAARAAALFITPPEAKLADQGAREVRNAAITRWGTPHPLAEGLNEADFLLAEREVFERAAGDVVIAECAAGPVIVLRSRAADRTSSSASICWTTSCKAGSRRRCCSPTSCAGSRRKFFAATALQASAPGLIECEMPPVREQECR